MAKERTLAPHVARAVAAVQAKLPAHARPAQARPVAAAPATRPAAAQLAPHVARAMAGAVSPKTAPPARTAAAHVAAAVAAPPAISPPAGRLPRLAAHLQAAQARMATPALPTAPAAHVAAARHAQLPGAVQAMKRSAPPPKNKAKKKRKVDTSSSGTPSTSPPPKEHPSVKNKVVIDNAVSNVNSQIASLDPSTPKFFSYTGTGIPTQPIDLFGLGKRALKLSREDSSLSNLAYATKGLSEVGPEIQYGVVSNRKSGQRHLRISGNSKDSNDWIRGTLPSSNRLEDFYKQTLRPHHVRVRREELQQNAQHLTTSEFDQVLEEAYQDFADDQDGFRTQVNFLAGYRVHKKFRKTKKRQRSKSARHLAYGSHKDWRLEVATNSKDIHAESAILTETLTNTDEVLEKVRGTKVPCVSCTTFFHGKKVPAAILNHTSGAWLSESSMAQLGFKLTEIENYLNHIHQQLKGAKLYSYDGNNGEIAIEDQTVELDPSSDSEDEEAHLGIDVRSQTTLKGQKLLARMDSFEARHFT